jgi:hypothetical protein
VDTAVAPAPAPAPAGRGHRLGWIIGSVVLAVVLVGAGGVGWWLRHPDPALAGGGSTFGMDGISVGDTVWSSVTVPSTDPGEDRVLRIEAVEPRVRRDDTAARIDYFVCTFDAAYGESHGVGAFGYGGDTREAERACTSLVPAVGATLDLSGDPVQQLVVSVTPTRPGVLAIPKHLVTWSVGWQSRTEQINEGLRIPAR